MSIDRRKTTLDKEQKEYLMAHTAKVLPNNASGQGLSALTIKKVYYEGFSILFEWLKNIENSGVSFDNQIAQEIENLQSEIKQMQETDNEYELDITKLQETTNKLLEDVDSLLTSNGWKTFAVELNVQMLDGTINGSATPEDIKVIDNYISWRGGKILDITLNDGDSEYIFLHTRTEKTEEKYTIVGVCILDNAEILPAKLDFKKSGLVYLVSGDYQTIITKTMLDTALENYVKKENIKYQDGIFTLSID